MQLVAAFEFEVTEGAQLEAAETAAHGAVALLPSGTQMDIGVWSIYHGVSQSMRRVDDW